MVQAAVSDQPGEAEFVRVLGNTTGSHLAGAKANPYGKLERFAVPLVPLADMTEWADLIKIDAEGHEANMIFPPRLTSGKKWTSCSKSARPTTPMRFLLIASA